MRILSTVTMPDFREHVLFVHAHPDDETIATGGTIATLLDAGASVTLLTCTRGERGEVVPRELQHLSGDALGAYREYELAQAMSALQLTDFRFLGNPNACAPGVAPHRYRDSGMQWGPGGAEAVAVSDQHRDSEHYSLTDVELDAVVADIVAVIGEVQPTAVVSYNANGGYGHPDHVRAHEAAGTAAILTAVPFFEIVPDDQGMPEDLQVDVRPVWERKRQALAAHRTQLTVEGDKIVHSGGQVQPISAVEVFRPTATRSEVVVDWAGLGVVGRVVSCLAALLVGSVLGIIGTVNYNIAWSLISLGIAGVFLVGLRLFLGSRVVAAFAAAGFLIVVTALSQSGPGGSILVPADTAGYVWAYGSFVVCLLVLAWPQFGAASRDTMVKAPASGKDVDSL